jgi:hypothetical protein
MDLAQFHEEMMGFAPTDEQLALYNEPLMRGFRESTFNRKRFLSVIILAIWLARPTDGTYRKVHLILPPTHVAWGVETLRVAAKHILTQLNTRPGLYDFVVKAISHIQMGSRIIGIDEPPLWVSYGFSPDALVPDWFPPKVLEVSDEHG